MAKKKTTTYIEEKLIDEAKRKKIKMAPIFEKALADKLGLKIERVTNIIKINNN